MQITLTPELEALIDETIKSGLYDSPGEVVRAGLRLVKEQAQLRELRREELRREIQKGIDDIKAGRYTTLETPEDYQNLAEEIKKEGSRLLAERKGGKK